MTKSLRTRASSDLTDLQWAFLNDAVDPHDPRRQQPEYRWRFYELECNSTLGAKEPIADRLWSRHRADVLSGWIEDRPGTRPSLWWLNDAPEERRPISGDGLNLFEAQAAYPDRLGLLEPSERERLPADAFDPVLILPAGNPYRSERRA